MFRKHIFIPMSKDIQREKAKMTSEDLISGFLLEKGGYMAQLSSGVFSYYPMMHRILQKIEHLISVHMASIGSNQIRVATMQPTKIWEESGRLSGYKADALFCLTDRTEKEFCLAPTAEEATLKLMDRHISYKDLPISIFQISTKFRDEMRPRYGLLRCKEFIMKDAYTFSETSECMHNQYHKMRSAYINILNDLELDYVIAKADGGAIASGNTLTEEFQVLSSRGEDIILFDGISSHNVEQATTSLDIVEPISAYSKGQLLHTKKAHSVPHVCKLLNLSTSQCLKSFVFEFDHNNQFVLGLALIRGDREINFAKLKQALSTQQIKEASSEMLSKRSFIPGVIGPINIPEQAKIHSVIIDAETRRTLANFLCGSNREEYHVIEDWDSIQQNYITADILKVTDNDISPNGAKYESKRGIEIGHIFCLGTSYSESMGILYTESGGSRVPFFMGCYGIGVTRLLAACLEHFSDSKGMVFPNKIAPFATNIIVANTEDASVLEEASNLYNALITADIDTIFDDRSISLGEKIHESNFLGIASHIVIGKKCLKSGLITIEFRNGDNISVDLHNYDTIINHMRSIANISLQMISNQVATTNNAIPCCETKN